MPPPRALSLLLPLVLVLACPLPPSAPALGGSPTTLERLITTLEPLALPLPDPGPSDWLANYPEAGHNLTMQHCTAHACNMNGSNNLPETDRSPAWLCPQCLAKLLHATGADPGQRFEGLLAFCERHGLEEEGAAYRRALGALAAARSAGTPSR